MTIQLASGGQLFEKSWTKNVSVASLFSHPREAEGNKGLKSR